MRPQQQICLHHLLPSPALPLAPPILGSHSLRIACALAPPIRGSHSLRIACAKKRTGKQRYPSEKKKNKRLLQLRTLNPPQIPDKLRGFWRLSNLTVPVDHDPGKDSVVVSPALLQRIADLLEYPVSSMLPAEAFSVVRKSFDARKLLKEPKFVYTVDMDARKLLDLEPSTSDFLSHLEPKIGRVEQMLERKLSGDLIGILCDSKVNAKVEVPNNFKTTPVGKRKLDEVPKIAVVGSGPSGLFSSLVLAELGAEVTLFERGQGVERRGRDIGSLAVRRILQPESNFCFGEGGAGTWSDGKLVTRIGRNSEGVLAVMNTLVHFGAPENILVDGKPHLGTDRLVPLLRNFRQHLQQLGVSISFGSRVDDLLIEQGHVVGVKISDSRESPPSPGRNASYDAVILAVGHSARDVYQMLLSHNVEMVPKDFAVGLRVEHPQELINTIQYSKLANEVQRGRGKVPVADYKVAKYVGNKENCACYSFCMCPGGQVVLTSTDPSELCINGMSFSRRSSKWANAALVVTVSAGDLDTWHGPLSGVYFQRELEHKAALLGGGDFVVPVQTVTDFLDSKVSATSTPPSSYRLGVKAASLHHLFSDHITEALQRSLCLFDKELPGFITKEALLHGVETRTSSPVQVTRDAETYESTSLKGLYPIGEGAGYAGGIVSAAVDGMYAGLAVAKSFGILPDGIESILGRAYGASFGNY